MTNEGVDDIFKDFEHKIKDKIMDKMEGSHSDKKEAHKAHEKKLSEEERLKMKYHKAEESLKHKYEKEKEALEEKKRKEGHGHGEMPHGRATNLERSAYVAVILILVAYIGVDLSFYHGSSDVDAEEQAITAAVAAVQQEDEEGDVGQAAEEKAVEEEKTVEEVKEEKKVLSGEIDIVIDNIYSDVSDKNDDLGYITKIIFTIENGKDKVLTPVVNVYAYDSKLHESWQERSRGEYIGNSIEPGDKQTGVIDLTAKTFRNLDLEKNIKLTLDGSEGGFIKSVSEEVTIS